MAYMSNAESTITDKQKIVIYSTEWCGYCKRLKTQLDSAGLGYEEINIEEDPASAQIVAQANNGNHVVPTLQFADGSTLTNPSLAQVKAKLADLT